MLLLVQFFMIMTTIVMLMMLVHCSWSWQAIVILITRNLGALGALTSSSRPFWPLDWLGILVGWCCIALDCMPMLMIMTTIVMLVMLLMVMDGVPSTPLKFFSWRRWCWWTLVKTIVMPGPFNEGEQLRLICEVHGGLLYTSSCLFVCFIVYLFWLLICTEVCSLQQLVLFVCCICLFVFFVVFFYLHGDVFIAITYLSIIGDCLETPKHPEIPQTTPSPSSPSSWSN